MPALVAKTGLQAGIPLEQIIDSERYVRVFTPQNAMVDAIHPNQVGYGALAQEIYMRLALSTPLKARIVKNFEEGLNLSQFQQFIATKLAEAGKPRSLVESPATRPRNLKLSEMMSKLYIDLPS
jgi:hypothetical protein